MADSEALTDDYVASLLAKDAKESSIRYSAMGMEGFMPSKPLTNKPKPNTRFLRSIIKETDNHNAALLAKEAAESRARLENLVEKDKRTGADIRRRQLGHISAHLRGEPSNRHKLGNGTTKHPKENGRRRNTSSEDEGKPSRSDDDESRRRRRRKDHRDSRESRTKSSFHDRSQKRHERRDDDRGSRSKDRENGNSRARSRSPRDRIKEERSRHRHRSPRRRASRSPSSSRNDGRRAKDRHKSRRRAQTPMDDDQSPRKKNKNAPPKTVQQGPEEDSDPLDEIIGPRPPPTPKIHSRGRGITSVGSGIDSRFSSNYDPATDVQLDPDEENDWDQALEALRDRQKWRQQGADRLRAAGFTDEEIVKWERGGEKKEEDVKWAKKGEGREWDRGKVLDVDGDVQTAPDSVGRLKDPEWGRLRGS